MLTAADECVAHFSRLASRILRVMPRVDALQAVSSTCETWSVIHV